MKIKSIPITDKVEQRSFALLRLIGYFLLVFSLVNYLSLFIPPRFTNPNWEFQVQGQMVDNIWSILLGLTFVFLFNENSVVKTKQIAILKFFSWVSLFIGIIYILMIPLGINNTQKIYTNANNQFNIQKGQQQKQTVEITQKLQQVTSVEQLGGIAASLNISIDPNLSQSPEQLKEQISQQIEASAKNTINTASLAKREQSINLIKTSIRVNLGSLLSGICLIGIWKLTKWVRLTKLK
ncbi:HpsJ family protein [Nodularia chucula]|uniref:HpsJ-like protein, cyanoexosortase A-associated n=1 Tax=Nodularia chucula TaxID=3093667 RepID=UPI0039C6A17F